MARYELRDGSEPDRLGVVRELFTEYQVELDEDLCFQSFEEEHATLPGKYGHPAGAILVAYPSGTDLPAGVVALRPLEGFAQSCEMKRMYVRPEYRGTGLGRILAEEILEEARRLGYREIVLDTLSKLKAAIALYRSLGFEEMPPYYQNPIESVVYMRKAL